MQWICCWKIEWNHSARTRKGGRGGEDTEWWRVHFTINYIKAIVMKKTLVNNILTLYPFANRWNRIKYRRNANSEMKCFWKKCYRTRSSVCTIWCVCGILAQMQMRQIRHSIGINTRFMWGPEYSQRLKWLPICIYFAYASICVAITILSRDLLLCVWFALYAHGWSCLQLQCHRKMHDTIIWRALQATISNLW